jgi:hypothetical protein
MPLPPSVRVKLSTETAGAISLTPVVVQELATRDLIEQILCVTGKDDSRIVAAIRRGTLVSGGSRFRWEGWDADVEDVHAVLGTFPDPDPARTFQTNDCVRAILRGGRQPIELPREAGERKGMFQRDSFWDVLMRVAAAGPPLYSGYSYRDRCDRYLRELSVAEAEQIRTAGYAVKYSTLRDQIAAGGFRQAELFTPR